jgi:[acyl-carrier-protein] S-malonyltransferase
MTKTIWVFPGQGSQAVGMGSDLLDQPGVSQRFEQAAEILGWSVSEICQSNEATLSKTFYTQPCMYVVESVLVDLLKAQGQMPDFVAGHSLGEYAALYAAGVFDFESGLKLIQRRATLMDQSTEGVMAALLGFDRAQLEAALADSSDVVLANDNNAGQVVISGSAAGVDGLIAAVKSKKAVKLNVSGAFHSPFMADAAAQFQTALDTVNFNPAQIPVLSNVEPTPTQDATELKARLAKQMTGSVRWREITLALPNLNVANVVEVGPGKVLVGIMKRTCGDLTYSTIGNAADLAR